MATAAVSDPSVTVTKTSSYLASTGPNSYQVWYTVNDRSTSATAVPFDLGDHFSFAPEVTVTSVTPTVSAGRATITPGFDGRSATDLATGTVSSSSGAMIMVRVDVTVAPGASATSADCVLAAGESGTGLRNTATVGSGAGQTATACRPLPGVSSLQIDKNVFGGNGTFTFDVVGSDGSTNELSVTTTTGRDVTPGLQLTPGVTYTITERDPGEAFRYYTGSGFCQVYVGSLQRGSVREVNGSLSFTAEPGAQYLCFVANLADGRITFDKVTTPRSVNRPFTVEIATRNADGIYTVVDTVRVRDRVDAVSDYLDSRTTYYVRELPTPNWTTTRLACGSASATGNGWVRVYVADGATPSCTITNAQQRGPR